MAGKIMDGEKLIVSTKVVADMFDVTTRRVGQLCEEGILTKIKQGSFELVPTVRDYIRFLKARNDTVSETTSVAEEFNKEHTLLEKAKREKAELEVALMKGQCHASEDVEREMTKMLSAFRSRVLSIPSKVAPKASVTDDITAIEAMLRDELYNALKELSEYDPKTFKHETYVDLKEVVADG